MTERPTYEDLEQKIRLLEKKVSDAERLQSALQQSEEKYRRIAENIADVVWTSDLNFNATYVSPSVEKMIGESVETHMKRALQERFPPDSLNYVFSVFREELEKENEPGIDKKSRSRFIELQHYRADGSLMWIMMNLSFIRDEQGKPIGVQGVTRDITERKRAEEEREQLIAELKQALSKIKTLNGLLPICASCKKIRDDQGYWTQIETYIRTHAAVDFTHGICPECARKLYPAFHQGSEPPQ